MSVPYSILGLLEPGARHGYDLKREYDAVFAYAPSAQVRAAVRDPHPPRARRAGQPRRRRAGEGARSQAVRHHRGRRRRPRPLDRRARGARAVPAADAVHQGRAGAAERAGRGRHPRPPALRAPEPDARADGDEDGRHVHRPAARRPRAVPSRGRPALDRPVAGAARAAARRRSGDDRRDHRGPRPREAVRAVAGARRRLVRRRRRRDDRRHGPERIGQVDAAALPGGRPGARRRAGLLRRPPARQPLGRRPRRDPPDEPRLRVPVRPARPRAAGARERDAAAACSAG